ncbi:TetR family transcriptional regulator C-terminal domain-containing protein [Streptomyces sp. NPDC093260]|uniref:TetR family transcriptional regulator C-terminal domain-containing protein n=1 Tax=Streptomyces sp. NPDC093260 TaxID=3155073 RepID=UPI00342CCF82
MAAFFDRLVDWAAANAERPGRTQMNNVLVAEAADPSHPAHAFFRARYDRVISGCERIAKDAVTAGELRSEADIHEIAVTIAAVMDGLQLQWALAPDTFDMPGHLRRILDAMYAGIKA